MKARSHLMPAMLVVMFLLVHPAWAEQVDCQQCHKKLTAGSVVHAAVQMGCENCHTGVDASAIPHKFAGRLGLSAESPGLCFQCHAKGAFTKKVQHAPISASKCLICHTPHSGPYESLLKAKGNALCRQCHEEIEKKRHPATARQGHALEGPSDPVRKGRPFGCISCHVPHSSDWGKLFRFNAPNASGLCKYCHDFLQ